MIQLYRLYFGHGNRASLATLDSVNPFYNEAGSLTSDLGNAHVHRMVPKVCSALTLKRQNESRAHNLAAEMGDSQVTLTWNAPTNPTGITGYRIRRGADEDSLTALVADTGSTATAYTDTTVTTDASYVYSVIVLKGAETGDESPRVTVGPSPPIVTSPGAFAVEEGETVAATLSATDEDTAAADLTWSISGGADSGKFTITSGGALAFAAAKDFEAPDDTGGDGTYEVAVQVSDGGRSASADIRVTLSNAYEAPTANAGPDQEGVAEGTTVTLSGTGADPDTGETLSYAWTQTAGTTVTLSAASAASTTFTAPTGLTEDVTLDLTLRVTDSYQLYDEDEVEVTVVAPEPPEVTASGPFTVVEGETVVGTLTATDEDTAAADLAWSITGGADSAKFAITSAGALTFAAAEDFESPDDADTAGTYEVTVQVSDGERTDTADVTVTLSNRNEAPTANAGEDQEEVEEGATVTLSGAGTDPDAGDTLTYAWSQTEGATVTLSAASTATTDLHCPDGTDGGRDAGVHPAGSRMPQGCTTRTPSR